MNITEEKSILKAISILGGTQVCNIAVGLVRNKAVSMLLGAAGMGCMSLFQSTSDILSTIANMGTSTTAVKNISGAYSFQDNYRIGYVSSAFKKIVSITGLAGGIICIILSPLLSYINFGDYAHITHFVLLSLSILGLQLVAGFTTLLQGCRKFKLMSKATLSGNILGLFICIPLYYLFGIKAIVPVMVLYPLINFCILRRVTQSVDIPYVQVSYREAITFGRDIISSGFFICLQSLFSLLYIYLMRLYISSNSGLETVGLFSASMLVVNQYVGLVFSSMGTEYYPRLSAVEEMNQFCDTINMQIKRTITVLTPLVILLMVFIPVVVRLLYTEEFLPICGMCVFLLSSIGFRVVEWCIGFSFIAKGKTKLLFFNESSFKIYTFILSIILFNIWGILGIGVAYLIAEFIFCVQSCIVANKVWHFSISKDCYKIFLPSIGFLLACCCAKFMLQGYLEYTIYIITFLYSTYNIILYFRKIWKK